jgi:aminoglycoside 6-adenylyltransferase
MAVTNDRTAECDQVLTNIAAWAGRRSDVRAVGVAGSWARGEPEMTSDLDVVVLTDDQNRYADDALWVAAAVGEDAPIVRTQQWGIATERRVRLASGFEVEFNFAPRSWAAIDPYDEGTARVVRAGFKVIVDRSGLLQRLVDALRR